MQTNRLLQVLAAAILLVGLGSLTASRVSTLPVVVSSEVAFSTGVVAVSVGFVMLADLRRRAAEGGRRAPKQS